LYENRADSQYFRRTSGDLVDENEEDDYEETVANNELVRLLKHELTSFSATTEDEFWNQSKIAKEIDQV
jgi:hypothetical protein